VFPARCKRFENRKEHPEMRSVRHGFSDNRQKTGLPVNDFSAASWRDAGRGRAAFVRESVNT